jgi:iron-sulfur cluster assembly protein
LALALDEPKDTDDSFNVSGYTFVIDKDLMTQAESIKIDMTYMGFQVESNLQLGGGGCGSSCSTSSCGH